MVRVVFRFCLLRLGLLDRVHLIFVVICNPLPPSVEHDRGLSRHGYFPHHFWYELHHTSSLHWCSLSCFVRDQGRDDQAELSRILDDVLPQLFFEPRLAFFQPFQTFERRPTFSLVHWLHTREQRVRGSIIPCNRLLANETWAEVAISPQSSQLVHDFASHNLLIASKLANQRCSYNTLCYTICLDKHSVIQCSYFVHLYIVIVEIITLFKKCDLKYTVLHCLQYFQIHLSKYFLKYTE